MHETTATSPVDPRDVDPAAQAPVRPVPRIIRRTTTQFGWRHVNGIAVIRFLVALWLVCLGCIVLSFGYWWGAFLLVGAALAGSLAYLMPRWKVALDAEKKHEHLR
jgi:hypothetical protein